MNAIKVIKNVSGLTNAQLSDLLSKININIKPTTITSRVRTKSNRATLTVEQMRTLSNKLADTKGDKEFTELLNNLTEARRVIDELIFLGGTQSPADEDILGDDFDLEPVAEPVVTEVAEPVVTEVAEPVVAEVAEPVVTEVAEPVTEEDDVLLDDFDLDDLVTEEEESDDIFAVLDGIESSSNEKDSTVQGAVDGWEDNFDIDELEI